MMRTRWRTRFGGALVCALLVPAGCTRVHVAQVPPLQTPVACQAVVPERDVLLGVSLSGGGSRAALFGAAGLEALAELRTASGASALERVAYLSSVSGGSLAAAYYALEKPDREVPVLTPAGAVSDAYRAFFERYRAVLSQDFERQLLRRHLASFRWFNSFLAAQALVDVLRKRLVGDAMMRDVGRREARGDSPGLIINTTLYNNGRRLVITTLPSDAFRYDFLSNFEAALVRRGGPDVRSTVRRSWEQLLPLTPVDIGADPCQVRLAGAVTSSASFPPLIGPVTLQVGGQETYWHAGDGGLYENQGVESLLFLLLRQLQEGRARRVLVLAFDSSFPFAVGDRRLSQRAKPFSMFSFDFSRVPGIMEERASAYRTLFFRTLQSEGVLPDDDTFRVIPLRHIEARWRDDLSDLPPACHRVTPPLQSVVAVQERVAEIPTRLRVASKCDRQLLATAAAKVVAQRRESILQFLDAPVERAGPQR
jgi:patatin-like phospholipase